MGAAASRARARGSNKKGKPAPNKEATATIPSPGEVVGSADIVLGSHVQAPPEAAPHHAAYDEILTWLDFEFRKNDVNRDGSLDYHECMRFVKSLDLNLSTKETFQFFALADRDNDERIVWSEIEQDVPFILATIYKALPPSPSDWCEMALPDDSGLAWFNKRTSEVRRERPPEMDAPTSPSATAVGAATATTATTAKEAVLKNTETLDALLTWLDWEFKKADFDKNGTLSREEVASFIQGLRLGLGPKEVERFCRLADFNGDGVVEWREVLELTPLLLQKLYSAIEPGPHDVCVIVDAQQRLHYLNKRTGATTATPPPGFVPPSSPGTAEAAASVVACGRGEEETTTSAVAESPSVRGTGPAASISTSSSVEGQTGAAAEGSSTATGATVE